MTTENKDRFDIWMRVKLEAKKQRIKIYDLADEVCGQKTQNINSKMARQWNDLKLLEDVARVLGVSPAYLAGWVDQDGNVVK